MLTWILQRRLLIALLALALLPGWPEVIENVEHLVHDGHLAHSEAHEHAAEDHAAHEQHADTDEHGCTPMAHRCPCHVSLAALIPAASEPPARGWLDLPALTVPFTEGGPLTRAIPPPTRPPIA